MGLPVEAFGAGIAAVVSLALKISWKGMLADCRLPEDKEAGETTTKMKEWIVAEQYRDDEHEWSYRVTTKFCL